MKLVDLVLKVQELSKEDLLFLHDFGDIPVLRKLMTSEEIKKCNSFVKEGLMIKGTSDDKYGTVQYYIDSYVYKYVMLYI